MGGFPIYIGFTFKVVLLVWEKVDTMYTIGGIDNSHHVRVTIRRMFTHRRSLLILRSCRKRIERGIYLFIHAELFDYLAK